MYFTSGIPQGHFSSAVLKACLYFLTPRFHLLIPNSCLYFAYLLPQRQNKFLVMTAAHQNGLKFLEDMISVFLSNLIVFLLHRTSEATVTQIFSVMLSPFSQLCLNSFLGLEGNPVCPPMKESRDISSSMCFGTTHFTLCIFHIS